MKKLKQHSISAIAPAKIILSGEHAVVYGAPALAMAINRFAETRITMHDACHLLFKLVNLNYTVNATLTTLKRLKKRMHCQYQEFLLGKCEIRDVIRKPFELLLYVVMDFIEQLDLQLPRGLEIKTSSNIPIGCGMGSSAAAILSVLYALAHYLGIKLDAHNYLNLGLATENLQHGNSSGLDLYVALHGGCVYCKNRKMHPRSLPHIPLQLINTGKPASSTGECVSGVMHFFKEQPQLLHDFENITDAFDRALISNDITIIHDCIRANHRLLCQLGVMPIRVQNFIAQVEKRGLSAKVSGAGSINGDNCGVILVLGHEDINDLVADYGYTALPVVGEAHGVKLI